MSGRNELIGTPMHARVFAENVVPDSRLHQTFPQESPRVVITAGQPGAGKGGLVQAARTEFRNNVVIVDPDALRDFVPGIKELKEQHPLKWSGESHPVAKAYADGLRDLSIQGRRNLIIDTTLAGADPVIGQIRTMQAKGYNVEIRAVASHRLESELGIDRRYTEDLVSKGSGRHVPGDFHDVAYKALPGNLDKVHEQTGARIRIYNREGVELYDSRTSPLKPGAALEQAREARLHDPKVTRTTAEIGREQQDFHRKLPETLERNPVISRETAKNLPPERAALDVVARIEHAAGEAGAIDFSTRIKPAVQTSVKVATGAAVGLDTVITARETARLLDQDNLPGAQSKILHFGARNIGMAGGAALGSSAGAAFGAPGMVIGGIAGGIGGGVAGESVAEVADRAHIYTQRGSDGHAWQSDPQHPERGWSRHAPAYGTDARGKATYDMQTLQANPRLASELDYKASSTAVELALAQAPNPRNPFSQPAGPGDAHAVDATPWTRDPATRQWSRYVADPTQAAMGNPTGSTEQASPQRSVELDRAAQATIAENLTQSRPAIAQRYQDAYEQYGWKQHGPVPAAVLNAEHAPPAQQPAPATASAARANPVPTPQQIEAAVAPRVAPQESHASSVKPTPGGMSFAEAHQRRDEPEKTSPGSLQPVGKQAQPDRLHELTLLREIGIVNAKTEQELGKAQGPQTKTLASPGPTQERAPQPAAHDTPAPRQAPAAQTSRPTQSEHTVAPVATAAPVTLAAAAAPMHSASAEPSGATAPVAPPAPRGGSDISAVHAQVAALQAQIARLTEQRGQDHPAPRSASEERFIAPAITASRAEPVASARTMDPRDASHPDHRDFQKIYTAVAQNGRWDAKQSGNIASQVLADFKAGPMGLRLDVVAVEPDLKGQLKVFAGHAPWGEHRGLLSPTVVDPTQAARVPAEQGFERLAQAAQRDMAPGQAALQR